MWMFYAISLPVTLGMVVWMLMYYASPRVLPHVRIIVAYAWFVNVSIVILVPVDVWTVRLLKSVHLPENSFGVCPSRSLWLDRESLVTCNQEWRSSRN